MYLIFLDVDGVINSIRKLKEVYELTGIPHSGINYPFDEICLTNLKKIVEETDAKIVITSTWRKHEDHMKVLLNKLKEYELDSKVIGCTLDYNNRETEIINFLLRFEKMPNYVILDDDACFKECIEHFVKTETRVGLTLDNAIEGIRILKKSYPK